ncbi:uncharacterized protein N7496_007551 [Penicillium cataractarum]|uniref:Dolichyl-diphosphooligosaccharide--protein glycosyltransferase subunit 4 n=1 Tax=Penicillium cataractarum TaxID=2100454 RepID=A0A9W9S5Q0_9EURO|nr:uncharacterized protein N7496_007551 [Penicillium cataractarum]KAJ5371459.1 hypothetical protein N7496_007551 [Penicillium cataractarum]
MISDGDLYRLAIFLGSCAMMMIVLYHFLDVNARDDKEPAESNSVKPARAAAKATSTPASESTPTTSPPTGNAL